MQTEDERSAWSCANGGGILQLRGPGAFCESIRLHQFRFGSARQGDRQGYWRRGSSRTQTCRIEEYLPGSVARDCVSARDCSALRETGAGEAAGEGVVPGSDMSRSIRGYHPSFAIRIIVCVRQKAVNLIHIRAFKARIREVSGRVRNDHPAATAAYGAD